MGESVRSCSMQSRLERKFSFVSVISWVYREIKVSFLKLLRSNKYTSFLISHLMIEDYAYFISKKFIVKTPWNLRCTELRRATLLISLRRVASRKFKQRSLKNRALKIPRTKRNQISRTTVEKSRFLPPLSFPLTVPASRTRTKRVLIFHAPKSYSSPSEKRNSLAITISSFLYIPLLSLDKRERTRIWTWIIFFFFLLPSSDVSRRGLFGGKNCITTWATRFWGCREFFDYSLGWIYSFRFLSHRARVICLHYFQIDFFFLSFSLQCQFFDWLSSYFFGLSSDFYSEIGKALAFGFTSKSDGVESKLTF